MPPVPQRIGWSGCDGPLRRVHGACLGARDEQYQQGPRGCRPRWRQDSALYVTLRAITRSVTSLLNRRKLHNYARTSAERDRGALGGIHAPGAAASRGGRHPPAHLPAPNCHSCTPRMPPRHGGAVPASSRSVPSLVRAVTLATSDAACTSARPSTLARATLALARSTARAAALARSITWRRPAAAGRAAAAAACARAGRWRRPPRPRPPLQPRRPRPAPSAPASCRARRHTSARPSCASSRPRDDRRGRCPSPTHERAMCSESARSLAAPSPPRSRLSASASSRSAMKARASAGLGHAACSASVVTPSMSCASCLARGGDPAAAAAHGAGVWLFGECETRARL